MSEWGVAPRAGVAAYAALLRDQSVRHLLAGTQAARLGGSMLPLALVLFGSETAGSVAAGGAVLAAFVLTSALQPARARLVDARGPAVLVAFVAAFAGMLAVLAALAAVGPGRPASLVAAAALAGALAPPLGPFTRALMGAALGSRPDVLQRAYALDSAGEEAALVLGPLLVAALTAGWSATAPLLLAAALMLAGGVGTARSALADALPAQSRTDRHRTRIPSEVWALVASFAAIGVALGAIDVALPAITRHAGVPPAAGLLLAAMALGTATAGLATGLRTWRRSPLWRLAVLEPLLALSLAACAAVRPLGALGVLLTVPGAVLGILFVTAYVAINELAPRGAATRSFAWLVTANNGGLAVGAALAGAVADASPHTALWLAPFAVLPAGALAVVAAARGRVPQLASQPSTRAGARANKPV